MSHEKRLSYRKAPKWDGGTMLERLAQCRFMLMLHGALTPTEARKVHSRLLKIAKKEAR